MWLVVGLGNPGAKYAQTRHNIGFMVVDRLAERAGGKLGTKKFSAQFGRESIAGRSVVLSKPQTFMNNSGDSVQPMAAFFNVPSARVLIIHDELDLSFGLVRIKQSGGHAGHNGLRSISSRWGGGDYPRVRMGSGAPRAAGTRRVTSSGASAPMRTGMCRRRRPRLRRRRGGPATASWRR